MRGKIYFSLLDYILYKLNNIKCLTAYYISYIIYIRYINYANHRDNERSRRNERLFFDTYILVCIGSAPALYSLVEAQTNNNIEKGASNYE